VFRQARHQVLGTLKDKVPTQVAKHDQGWHFSSSFRLRAFSLIWNSTGGTLRISLGGGRIPVAGPENRNMQNSQDFHLQIAIFTTGNRNANAALVLPREACDYRSKM
jgi:hypothetical protein